MFSAPTPNDRASTRIVAMTAAKISFLNQITSFAGQTSTALGFAERLNRRLRRPGPGGR